jgi:hypothetical protein
MLAMQLTAALDAPLLLYVSTDTEPAGLDRVARGWEDLVTRVVAPRPR